MRMVIRKEGLDVAICYFEVWGFLLRRLKNSVTEVARNELYQGLVLLLEVVRTRKMRKVKDVKVGAEAANIYITRLKGIIMKNSQKFLEVREI